jgi:hypothetical protein
VGKTIIREAGEAELFFDPLSDSAGTSVRCTKGNGAPVMDWTAARLVKDREFR